jgi:hypothetical protein
MKKFVLFSISIVSALIVTELIVANIIGYPGFGVGKKIFGIQQFDVNQNIYKPYSEYWTVEGGNKVYKRNNIGCPGTDIKVDSKNKYIFVLGSSYIESYPVEPDLIATSIYQSKLNSDNNILQVINLGASGHDPYDLYFRSSYFENKFFPEKIILVIDDVYEDYFNRHHHPLNFDLSQCKWEEDLSFPTRSNIFLRNNLSIVNLIVQSVKDKAATVNKSKQNEKISADSIKLKIPSDLFVCLKNFNDKYQTKFICISIIANPDLNSEIKSYCEINNINFLFSEINKPENKINEVGHLNIKGNKSLGEKLYDSFH